MQCTFFPSFDEQVNSPPLLPKQPSIRLGWSLPSFLRTILPQLRVQEMSIALHLQIGLKNLCVGPKRELQGHLRSWKVQLLPPPTSTVLTDSEMLSYSGILENIWSYLQCMPLSHSSQLITLFLSGLLRGGGGGLIICNQPVPKLSYCPALREGAQLKSAFPLVCTCPLHTSLGNFIHRSKCRTFTWAVKVLRQLRCTFLQRFRNRIPGGIIIWKVCLNILYKWRLFTKLWSTGKSK